jgi:hypothetical protein
MLVCVPARTRLGVLRDGRTVRRRAEHSLRLRISRLLSPPSSAPSSAAQRPAAAAAPVPVGANCQRPEKSKRCLTMRQQLADNPVDAVLAAAWLFNKLVDPTTYFTYSPLAFTSSDAPLLSPSLPFSPLLSPCSPLACRIPDDPLVSSSPPSNTRRYHQVQQPCPPRSPFGSLLQMRHNGRDLPALNDPRKVALAHPIFYPVATPTSITDELYHDPDDRPRSAKAPNSSCSAPSTFSSSSQPFYSFFSLPSPFRSSRASNCLISRSTQTLAASSTPELRVASVLAFGATASPM